MKKPGLVVFSTMAMGMAIVGGVWCQRREGAVSGGGAVGGQGKAEAAVVSPGRVRDALEPREFWVPLDRGLEELVAGHPGRPMLLSVSARWSMTATLSWRSLFSDEVTGVLEDSGFVCVVADVTEGDEVGREAVRSLGQVAVPLTAIYDPVAGEWMVMPQVFEAGNVKEWVTAMRGKMAGE